MNPRCSWLVFLGGKSMMNKQPKSGAVFIKVGDPAPQKMLEQGCLNAGASSILCKHRVQVNASIWCRELVLEMSGKPASFLNTKPGLALERYGHGVLTTSPLKIHNH